MREPLVTINFKEEEHLLMNKLEFMNFCLIADNEDKDNPNAAIKRKYLDVRNNIYCYLEPGYDITTLENTFKTYYNYLDLLNYHHSEWEGDTSRLLTGWIPLFMFPSFLTISENIKDTVAAAFVDRGITCYQMSPISLLTRKPVQSMRNAGADFWMKRDEVAKAFNLSRKDAKMTTILKDFIIPQLSAASNEENDNG